jgi:hypothetical protein
MLQYWPSAELQEKLRRLQKALRIATLASPRCYHSDDRYQKKHLDGADQSLRHSLPLAPHRSIDHWRLPDHLRTSTNVSYELIAYRHRCVLDQL